MRRCVLIALASGQKSDAWHGGRHIGHHAVYGLFGDLLDAGGFGAFLAGHDHIGFQHHAVQRNPGIVEFAKDRFEGPSADLKAAVDIVDRVRPVHLHFRLDNRHDASFLTQRRVSGQRMGVGLDGVPCRPALADGNHRPPFGETGAETVIFGQPLAQAVKTLRHRFTVEAGQRLGAGIDLDARHGAGIGDKTCERRTVSGFLAQGFIEQDNAGNVILHGRGAEQHFAIIAAIIEVRFHIDGIEPLLDRARTFISGKDAAAFGHHGVGNIFQALAHGVVLLIVTCPSAGAQGIDAG